jgi:hypothetical protein
VSSIARSLRGSGGRPRQISRVFTVGHHSTGRFVLKRARIGRTARRMPPRGPAGRERWSDWPPAGCTPLDARRTVHSIPAPLRHMTTEGLPASNAELHRVSADMTAARPTGASAWLWRGRSLNAEGSTRAPWAGRAQDATCAAPSDVTALARAILNQLSSNARTDAPHKGPYRRTELRRTRHHTANSRRVRPEMWNDERRPGNARPRVSGWLHGVVPMSAITICGSG